MAILINKLKNYGPTNPKKVKSRQEVLDNVNRLYTIRNEIVKVFENKIFRKQKDTTDMPKSKDQDSTKQLHMLKLEGEISEQKQQSKRNGEITDWILVGNSEFTKTLKTVDKA